MVLNGQLDIITTNTTTITEQIRLRVVREITPGQGLPTVAVVNAASYGLPELPNGSIAQGSMFIGFGAGMGPALIAFPSPWPFPEELAGTRVQVQVGWRTVDCFLVYTSAGQIAAILPSDTPLGAGTITVLYNGAVAATGPINVVAHSFGIFTINQQGRGPAVATDPLAASKPYTIIDSAAPGEFLDIWGTGLGAVNFPDEGPTTPATLDYDVQVYVAGEEQTVLYADRSGCCSAIDQIRIKAPEMTGCFLPVVVVVEGVVSNYATLSIDPAGEKCRPDLLQGGPTVSQLQTGSVNVADIVLGRTRYLEDDSIEDIAEATYNKITIPNPAAYAGVEILTRMGACTVYQTTRGDLDYPDLLQRMLLNVGAALPITGPGGNGTLLPDPNPGYYYTELSPPDYYQPGLTTVTIPGGSGITGHMAQLVVPAEFEWLNPAVTASSVSPQRAFRRSPTQPQGIDAAYVIGASPARISQDSVAAAGFVCIGDPAAGTLTVPTEVLGGLPASVANQGLMLVGGLKLAPITGAEPQSRLRQDRVLGRVAARGR